METDAQEPFTQWRADASSANPRNHAAPTAGQAPDRDPERLVGAYADTILRLCYAYLRSTADAEDICQEVLIKLIGRAEPFNDYAHERAWVIRVTINACKDALRRAQAHPQVGLDEIPEPEDAAVTSESEELERQRRVVAAVHSLPESYREVIHLHYYEGLGVREVARAVGCTEACAQQRLTRARKQLRALLKGDLS